MNADNLLFRASSMGDIITSTKKGWDVENSLTCKRKLVQMYRELMWKRKCNKSNKYVEKGLAVEEDAITLFCRIKKEVFTKNTTRLNSEFFTGEVDLFIGEGISKAEKTIDIKSCWDWTTLPSICDTVDDDYDYQGQTYMSLTGSKSHTIAYCLVNTPANLIQDEKRKLAWKMGIIENETLEYIEGCIEIEKNCIVDMDLFLKHNPFFEFHYNKCELVNSDKVSNYSPEWIWDIPMNERLYEIEVLRDDVKIEKMQKRIIECRAWMNINLFNKLLKAA